MRDDVKNWCAENIPNLKWNGTKGRGRCPLPSHGGPDAHPSFSIDAEKGVYFCHAEKLGGTLDQLAQKLGASAPPDVPNIGGRIVETYSYRSADGDAVYCIDRFHPKRFVSKRPDPESGWILNLEGIAPLPYRLPELIEAQAEHRRIYIVEGEKDVETLRRLGYVATCNHGGAGKWGPDHSKWFDKTADIVILPDNDDPGVRHGCSVAQQLLLKGCRVKIVRLPSLGPKQDVTDWLGSGHDRAELEELVEAAPNVSVDECDAVLLELEFDDAPAISLENAVLPRFPVDALPPALADFVEATAEAIQISPDVVAMGALSAVSACVAGKGEIVVDSGYVEPLNIYTLSILGPGTRKSAAFSAIKAPLAQHEAELAESAHADISRAKAGKELLQTRLEIVKSKLKKAGGDNEDFAATQAEFERLTLEAEDTVVPAYPKLLIDNATTERISSLLSEQGGRIAILSAEGTIFEIMEGRYNKNGADIDVFLKGHAGDTLILDRQRDRQGGAPVHVSKPCVTIGIAAQPRVLEKIGKEDDFAGKGLLARFAYCFPEDLVGSRKVRTQPVPAPVRRAYDETLRKLLSLRPMTTLPRTGEFVPHPITLSAEAEQNRLRFAEDVEKKLARGGELFFLRDWGGKVTGLTLRIAGLLHLVEECGRQNPWEIPLSAETYCKAVRIAEYLIPHAKAAYGMFREDPRIKVAKEILEWAKERGQAKVNRRVLFNAIRSRTWINSVEELDLVLRLMADTGYIVTRKETKPGVIKPSYFVLFRPSLVKSRSEPPRRETIDSVRPQSCESPTQLAQLAQLVNDVTDDADACDHSQLDEESPESLTNGCF